MGVQWTAKGENNSRTPDMEIPSGGTREPAKTSLGDPLMCELVLGCVNFQEPNYQDALFIV
jgi:hypothetical protein